MEFNKIKRLIIIDDLNNNDIDKSTVLSKIQDILLVDNNEIECYFIGANNTTKYGISRALINDRSNDLTEQQRSISYSLNYLNQYYENFVQFIKRIIDMDLQADEVELLLIDYRIPDGANKDESKMTQILTSLYHKENPDDRDYSEKSELKVVGYSSWQTETCRNEIIEFRNNNNINNLFYMTISWEEECKIAVRYEIKNHIN